MVKALALVALTACTYARVGSGEVAVVRTPGGMDPHVYTPGDWRIGGDDVPTTYSVRSQEHTERLEVQSSDGLGITLDTSIRYHVISDQVLALDQELGPDYYHVLLGPTLKSQARRVVGQYKPEEIYSTEARQDRAPDPRRRGRRDQGPARRARGRAHPQRARSRQHQAAITDKLQAEQAALKMKFVIAEQEAQDQKRSRKRRPKPSAGR